MKLLVSLFFITNCLFVSAQENIYFGKNLTLEAFDKRVSYQNLDNCFSSGFDYNNASKNQKMAYDITSSFLISDFELDTRRLEVNSKSLQYYKEHKYIEDGFYGGILELVYFNWIR